MRYLLSLFLILPSMSAFALDVEFFEFTNSKTYALTDDALLENSVVKNNYPWMFTAAFDYVKVPLSVQNNNRRTEELVKSLTGLHLGGGVRVTNSFFIGARTYVAQLSSGEKGTYWGDSVIEAKWRFYQGEKTAIALAPAIYLPTGTNSFTSDNRKVGEYLGLNFERNFDVVQVSIMAGYANRPGATFNMGTTYTSIDYKQSLYTAIGTIFPLSESWALNIEGYRYNQLKGNQHPNEGYVGLRHQTTPSMTTFFGGSVGGLVDKTANDYRISLGIKYAPENEEVKKVVEHRPAPVEKPKPAPTKREAGLIKEKALYGSLIAYESIYFANGSNKLDNFSKDVVKKFFASAARLTSEYKVVLEGFASKKGNPASNLILSQKRILSTRSFLNQIGATNKTMTEVAYGDSAADSTVDEALNRKVMLRLYRK